MNIKEKGMSFTVLMMILSTLLSKALGMVRGMMTAWTLGESVYAVAFTAAAKVPSAVFDFLFSAAILGCFIPLYNKAKERSEQDASAYSSAFITAVMLLCAALSFVGILLARPIISLVAPKISAEAAHLAAVLLRIMFPMMIFTAGAYTLTGILQSLGNFILPSLISAVSNLFMIAYLALCGERFSIYIFSLVFTLSWLLQFLTLALPLLLKRRMPAPSFRFKNEYLRSSAKKLPSIIAGSWLTPACVMIASFFSSFVSETTFVAYDYSYAVYAIISGVAVYGVGNFIFPSLSRLAARSDSLGFAKEAKRAVFSILLIILPVFAATLILAGDGIRLLYLRGNFTEELAAECALSLRALAPAIIFYALSEIFSRVFYASGKTRAPMSASLVAIGTGVISNIVLVLALGIGLVGISLSYTVAMITQAAVLIIFAKRDFPDIFKKINVRKSADLALAFALSLLSMTLLSHFIGNFSEKFNTLSTFLKIAIVFTIGIVIYLIYIAISKIFRPRNFFGKGEK